MWDTPSAQCLQQSRVWYAMCFPLFPQEDQVKWETVIVPACMSVHPEGLLLPRHLVVNQ